ncbi:MULTISPECIES: peroxiredoxin family protein [Cyanophyceae]|uniref:Peroxiredoxin family protein n=1 Tax=Leptolyngbya subtilissima DQ-A4 TaxID=2933933 RepID=A0ABV0K260_9CYAN|nr:peroxiredoxin family protein [Nodosilinea sp. FACHB-141]MBD2111339.1 redoxin domain-containing protein [Nodosilinea sp. FACHB-141]
MTPIAPLPDQATTWRYWLPLPPRLGLPLGQICPDFALWDVTYQRTVRLANWRGKQPVVLLFCRLLAEIAYSPQRYASLVAFNQVYDQFRNAGAEVLAIGNQPQRQAQAAVEDLSLRLPLLCDPAGASFRAYHTGQALGAPLPAQFVLDAQGRLRYCHLFSLLHPTASPGTLLAALSRL